MIYKPPPQDGYEWVNCVNQADYEVVAALDGSARLDSWYPIAIKCVPAEGHGRALRSDFPWLGSDALVLRKSAVFALRSMLDRAGELLPLECKDGTELYLFNVINVLDALDHGKSEILYFPESRRIMQVKTVAFLPDVIRDADIFRLPHRASATFVSSRFVDAVRSADLEGLDFVQVWPQAMDAGRANLDR